MAAVCPLGTGENYDTCTRFGNVSLDMQACRTMPARPLRIMCVIIGNDRRLGFSFARHACSASIRARRTRAACGHSASVLGAPADPKKSRPISAIGVMTRRNGPSNSHLEGLMKLICQNYEAMRQLW